ncbi:hypothetical protein E5288_WYG014256 [Bos mutus]|uniref:Uncharacterized protein n=1 Tax=Bos mutus TaxID=72004 RepID=A0A6B0R5V0_9CETA|nr:hypothetical protein [Bos mutus]
MRRRSADIRPRRPTGAGATDRSVLSSSAKLSPPSSHEHCCPRVRHSLLYEPRSTRQRQFQGACGFFSSGFNVRIECTYKNLLYCSTQNTAFLSNHSFHPQNFPVPLRPGTIMGTGKVVADYLGPQFRKLLGSKKWYGFCTKPLSQSGRHLQKRHLQNNRGHNCLLPKKVEVLSVVVDPHASSNARYLFRLCRTH